MGRCALSTTRRARLRPRSGNAQQGTCRWRWFSTRSAPCRSRDRTRAGRARTVRTTRRACHWRWRRRWRSASGGCSLASWRTCKPRWRPSWTLCRWRWCRRSAPTAGRSQGSSPPPCRTTWPAPRRACAARRRPSSPACSRRARTLSTSWSLWRSWWQPRRRPEGRRTVSLWRRREATTRTCAPPSPTCWVACRTVTKGAPREQRASRARRRVARWRPIVPADRCTPPLPPRRRRASSRASAPNGSACCRSRPSSPRATTQSPRPRRLPPPLKHPCPHERSRARTRRLWRDAPGIRLRGADRKRTRPKPRLRCTSRGASQRRRWDRAQGGPRTVRIPPRRPRSRRMRMRRWKHAGAARPTGARARASTPPSPAPTAASAPPTAAVESRRHATSPRRKRITTKMRRMRRRRSQR
mmetsp:Transcript_19868/g.37899  ORF Transcript_19868/g.37899 Transcript_19868/m.37899 type:complete len:413 (+) Transcript_19868:2214-3452(+)